MAYATINELKMRLGQDYAGLYGTDEAGTATAQADLDAAAAEIDAAAGCRYETPVVSVRAEALLRDWNLTLCEERARVRCAGDTLPGKLKLRIDHVRESLAKTVSGELVLPGAAESVRGQGIATVACDAPVFTRETMKGY
jgi:phage gp36-like protein